MVARYSAAAFDFELEFHFANEVISEPAQDAKLDADVFQVRRDEVPIADNF